MTRGRSLARWGLGCGATLLLAAGLGLAWFLHSPRRAPEGQPALSALDVDSLPAFRDAFNAAAGRVRVLVLLSPT